MEELRLRINKYNLAVAGEYEQALAVLSCCGEAAVPFLVELLSSSDVDQRILALHGFSEIQHPTTKQALQAGFSDPEMIVQYSALLGMRKQPDADYIPDLIPGLNKKDSLYRRLAADALAAIGESVIKPLAEVLEHGEIRGRVEAARALCAINHEDTIPLLFAALDDPSPLVHHWAREGLTRKGLEMVYFLR